MAWGMQLILKWAIVVCFSKLTQKLPIKMGFQTFFEVGNFCVFFQINTKIAHLLATAEFKLLPQVGNFCVFCQTIYSNLKHCDCILYSPEIQCKCHKESP